MTETGMPDRNRGRKATRAGRKSGVWRGLAVVASAAMIAAACGGGSKKGTASSNTTDTTVTSETTAAPTAETSSTVPGDTSTTAAAAHATTTTARKVTATTAKKSAVIANPNNSLTKAPSAGGSVGATTSTAKAADVQIGGSITWLKAGEIPTLDPAGAMANSGASDGPAGFAVFDMLAYTDGGQVKTHTAESIT